jgi:hypothetical protein
MSDVPAWLQALVERVAEAMTAHSPSGPLGFRYREEEGLWDVLVYPLAVELVGGAHDGDVASPGFSLDLQQLQTAFGQVDALVWNAQGLGPADPDGPCVSLEGLFEEHEVWLRILAYAPEDEEPGLKFDTNRR